MLLACPGMVRIPGTLFSKPPFLDLPLKILGPSPIKAGPSSGKISNPFGLYAQGRRRFCTFSIYSTSEEPSPLLWVRNARLSGGKRPHRNRPPKMATSTATSSPETADATYLPSSSPLLRGRRGQSIPVRRRFLVSSSLRHVSPNAELDDLGALLVAPANVPPARFHIWRRTAFLQLCLPFFSRRRVPSDVGSRRPLHFQTST